ncbi:Precorrin-6A reductase [Rhodobacteraceae bacterium THAF1]|uniref:cobalt-precorrin-6A reductase n=1 Tax=Palleronia sp. THAF1 TaxID=2587842 RepID=UPI000F3B4FE5|nr:cobalt-precorrin-6A reductase [Palleronia sp. THAF1]QFU09727.1 Precorrin-6A reductase [Palleronia sp. THAF1]VDC17370.1 Precorrin-6A reductase [Rhodobacteraceae bacterium THAF1]
MNKPNLLILGGTTGATALARAVSDAGLSGVVSFAGRVERPVRQPLPQRVGGFGGVDGLAAYLRENAITHLIDATHPFAAQMSGNAIAAAASVRVPLIALTRAPWQAAPGDDWTHVPDIAGAVTALDGPRKRVMLAVGRMHLAEFAPNPQHFYLLRLVDPPQGALPLPDCQVEVSRGPFTAADDRALMERHGIELIVSKNAGGTGAVAKLQAARALGLPVVMIDRPAIPKRREAETVGDVMAWIAETSA